MFGRKRDESIITQGETGIENKEKKNKKWLLVIFIIFISLVLILASVGIYGIFYVKKNFNYNYNEITSKPEDLGFEEVKSDTVINIALFGIDTRNKDSFKGLSDSIMILSVNTTDKKVKLISVLRDSLVPIEANGKTTYSKINSAYSKGGPELAIKTLNTIFDLDISEYATVNFYGMAEIIDAMGGIEATVTNAEVARINQSIKEQCAKLGIEEEQYLIASAGVQHLNGIQGVAYSRIRYVPNADGTSNDYGRTDRQRYVLGQLFNKATKLGLAQYVDLVKALSPYCETSLSYTEILTLAAEVLLRSPTFEESRVPFTEYTMPRPNTNAGSVVYYDLNFAAKLIHSFIYNDINPKDYIAANGLEKNNWYATGFVPPEIDAKSLLVKEEVTENTDSQVN